MPILVQHIAHTGTQTHTQMWLEHPQKTNAVHIAGTGCQCVQNIWLRPTAFQSSESRFFEHSKCSVHYLFIFSLRRLVFTAMCFPFILSTGVQNKAPWCSRGEVKALCTACQITFLMTSLSGFFISEKRQKKRGGG